MQAKMTLQVFYVSEPQNDGYPKMPFLVLYFRLSFGINNKL